MGENGKVKKKKREERNYMKKKENATYKNVTQQKGKKK